MRRPWGRQRGLREDRGSLGKTEGNWGTEGAWQGARGFDRDKGTQRVLAKTPQN